MLLQTALTITKTITKSYNVNKDTLSETASFINKSLPTMIDKDTRLDNVSVRPAQLIYNYTLVNINSSQLNIDLFRIRMETAIKKKACTNEDLKSFFENGVSIGYRYKGNDGVHITSFVITPKDCGY